MIVKCIGNTGQFLRLFEYSNITNPAILGRFGAIGLSQFGVQIGVTYRVMGIFIAQEYQGYLVDDGGYVQSAPCLLFEILDNTIPSDWKFSVFDLKNPHYPLLQAVFGYEELVSDPLAIEKLIGDMEETACRIYFRKKLAYEKEEIE
jgi:hypothetical protein